MAHTKMTLTERKLAAMLTENTGRAMSDSGGAYGRNWERNQGRAFKAEPATVLGKVESWVEDGADYEPDVTHNVFHFLAAALDYDPALNRKYQAFARKLRGEEYEPEICDQFVKKLARDGAEVGGIYGDGDPFTVNTYNGEDLLSQVLQYKYFSIDREEYVLLQIHGGCDVRGGYTDAVAFKAGDGGERSIYDNAKATIVTVPPEGFTGPDLWQRPFWTTDDAYHWYRDGACGQGAGRQLETYPISRDPENRGKGTHVFVDEDGKAHCPESGFMLDAMY